MRVYSKEDQNNRFPLLNKVQDSKLEEHISQEKLTLLHNNLLIAIPGNFFCAALVFFSLYYKLPQVDILVWFFAVLAITMLRSITYFMYKKDKNYKLKKGIFALGTLTSAALWGFCALFLMPLHSMIDQMVILVIIAGITAGGLQTLMPDLKVNISYVSLIIIPLVVWLAMQHSFSYTILAIANTVYLIFMVSTAKRGYQTLDESLHLRYENIELIKILREQSLRDPLTKLFNRRFLLEVIPRELKRLIHEKRDMSVCMIDVDYFKRINDNFGHDAGDEVLRFIGQELQEAFRGSDIACRFGGEEFVLVLMDANLAEATKRLESFCTKVKAARLVVRNQQLPDITLSIGLAQAPIHGSNIEELINASDKALYHAKRVGRDRIEIYDSTKTLS